MTRHAKNSTAGAVYTYHEKKKDTQQSGYGTQAARLSKDSVKDFDCCSLTLQPCRNPVITPDGFLYDKEAILESLLHQKIKIVKETKAYEKQLKKLAEEEKGKVKSLEEDKYKAFVQMEKRLITKPLNSFTPSTSTDSSKPSTSTAVAEVTADKDKHLPSFWVPSLTPEAKPTLLSKPDTKTRCPMSGKPLKIKDLIPMKLKLANNSETGKSLIAQKERYVCSVTGDVLGNSVPCAVLRNTGNVVSMDCVERLIKKDMLCPFTGNKLKDSDIIQMQRGGTGFAGSGVSLEAKKDGPAMQSS